MKALDMASATPRRLRGVGGWATLRVLAWFSGVAVALMPRKQAYRVGIDSAWAGDDLAPTFGEYLTSSVGSLYTPGVTFSTSTLALSPSDPASFSGLDFVFASPGVVSCLEESSDVTPLLTLKARHGSSASALVGGVLFTTATKVQVGALADVSGQRVSSSGIGRGLAFLAVNDRLGAAGVSLVLNASQLIFSPAGSSGGVIADVLEGRADVGVVETGALEREAASNGAFSMSQVKVVGNLVAPAGFSLLTSTELLPQWGLVSMTNVDRGITVAVAKALLSLNASSAQAMAGGFDSFTIAASYEPVRSLHAKQGLLDRAGTCKPDGSDAFSSVLCPTGTYVRSALELLQSCSQCPLPGAGYQCVCKPCVPGGSVETFSEGKLCTSWELCGASAPQGTERTFHVVDNLRRAGANFSYTLARAQGASTAGLCTYDNETERQAHRCRITLAEEMRGAHTMRIVLNGSLVSGAIHRVLVTAGGAEKCGNTGLVGHFMLSDIGECICAVGALPVAGGGCMRAADLIPIIVILPVLVIVVFFLLFAKREKKRMDLVWKIDFSDIHVSHDSLGPGTFGQVLRGDYRGRPVAIKRTVPTVEDMQAIIDDAVERRARNSVIASMDMLPSTASVSRLRQVASVSKLKQRQLPNLLSNTGEETEQDRKKATTGQFGTMARSADSIPLGSTSSKESLGNDPQQQNSTAPQSSAASNPPVLHHQLVDDFMHEMRFVVRLRHPCIVSVIGGVLERGITPLMVMQICDTGSLSDLVHNNPVDLEPEMALPILKDIVQGMHFLHSIEPPIVHGDLRTQKVLIDTTFRAKVTDYGFSQKRRMGLQFSRAYMSPELLIESVPTKSSDVYAFGVLMCEVLSRQEPYAGENFEQVLREVIDIDKKPPKRPVPPAGLADNVSEMMSSCWHKHAVVRPSFEELKNEMKKMTIVGLNEAALKRRVKQHQMAHTLHEVFPKHIADQLVQGKKVAAERKAAVTIFFSDIVGFTDISGTFTPEKVSNMLDRLYTRFDTLSEEFDVFKVETIGDAYMAVSNLVKNQNPDHCARIARFGLCAIEAANETLIDEDDPERGTVNIRVGFHTGPVVANVVGSKNPRYCLFGDTVTTAAKMESNSIVNRVHCTRKAADVLRQQAPGMLIEERGSIDIKGKGPMVTFWVNGEDENRSSAARKTSASILFAFSSAANKFKLSKLRTRAHKQQEVSALLGSAPNTKVMGRLHAKIKVLHILSKIQKASTANRVAPAPREPEGSNAVDAVASSESRLASANDEEVTVARGVTGAGESITEAS